MVRSLDPPSSVLNIRRMEFSPNVSRLQPSATIAVSSLAKRLRTEGRDIIDLSAGEPDFDTPEWMAEGAVSGIRAGQTRYTPVPGMPELRVAIAQYLESVASAPVKWEGVVVGSGAKQALFNAVFSLFGPGNEVLVAAPYWTSYPQIVSLAGSSPVFVSGSPQENFLVTPLDLTASYTEHTKGLILCSPCNPTGAVYSLEELGGIAEWAKARGITLIADEIYREIYFGDDRTRAASILELPEESVGRYVLIDGASKSFAMTGWRIGFSYSDVEMAKRLTALQSHTTSNAATPSQIAALSAFADPERARGAAQKMVVAFRRRRDLVAALLRDLLPQVRFVEPLGAFYFFLQVDTLFRPGTESSTDFCSWLLEETGVAMVPGVAFGDDRFVRLSFATFRRIVGESTTEVCGSG